MKATNFLRVGLTVALGALVGYSAVAKEPKDDKKPKQRESMYKSAGTPRYAVLNINNLTTWMRHDGHSNHSPGADNGLYYPRGTGNAIYQDCVVWGGKVYTNAGLTSPEVNGQRVRVGGGTYGIGTRAGKVDGFGATAVARDASAPEVRVYRVRRDYASMTNDDLARDAASVNEISVTDVSQGQMDDVLAQYALDWANWPVALGAPYIDRNGNGVYDAPPAFNDDANAGVVFTVDSLISQGRDEPGVAGGDPNSPADQVIWTVYNDLNESDARAFEGSYPIGVEVQKTIWGYKRTDALGNLYFSRYKFINVGGVDTSSTAGSQLGSFWVDSMYFCQWSDPDLGSFSDDLLGCDTVLSMGFVYNANGIDDTYRSYNLPPPAAGYDFLAGPTVPAPGDSGVFDLKRVYDVRNLGMSSFAYFSAGSPYSDPPGGTGAYTNGTGRWWKMLRGFAPLGDITTADAPYAYPVSPSVFPMSGDPSKPDAPDNWVDGAGESWSFAPGDRRLLVTTGPFSLAPGDTQEVYVGVVVGIGADRLTSVAVMKFNDQFVQNTFDALFQVPKSPVAPDVTVAELDGEIVLHWGTNTQRVTDTETRVNAPGNYVFEGYNVYQVPSRNSQLSEGVRVATFDLTSDPTVILDQTFDEKSGQILSLPIQFGANSGIKRYIQLSRDYVRDIEKLWNGQEYYYIVTAYSRATVPGFLPAALESDPTVLVAQPKAAFGRVYQSSYGDTLEIVHTGSSDGTIRPIVVDPTATTGATYEVRFNASAEWSVVNVSTTPNTTVISGQTNQSGDEDYSLLEGGVFLKVEGPAPGLNPGAWSWGPSAGSRFMTWVGGNFGFEDFNGAIGWASPRNVFGDGTMLVTSAETKSVMIRFKTTSDNIGTFNTTTDDTSSYAYRYGRGFTGAPANPAFVPWMTNVVGGGYSFQDYRHSAPLAAYDVDANPPRRLTVGYLENNSAGGTVNGFYWPPDLNGDNIGGGGPREWLFVFDEDYSGATANATNQTDIISGNQRAMYWYSWTRRNTNPWIGNQTFTVVPTRPNTPTDVFTYTTPAPAGGAALDKVSADKVGVFPNPYYAYNPQETSRFARFVTFNNLPPVAKVRIFNLAGQLVRVLDKNDDSQYLRWDLTNHATFPVASGMYIAHVEMKLPSDNSTATKVLKFAVIQEQEILNSY